MHHYTYKINYTSEYINILNIIKIILLFIAFSIKKFCF